MKPLFLTAFIMNVFLSSAFSQMPQTDVYFFNYESTEKEFKILSLKKISQGSGYNNQPFILPGCKSIYYTSNIFDTSQTEILQYDIQSGATTRLTQTPLSEYSPGIRPQTGGLSHVRVESDLKQHLRLLSDTSVGTRNMVPVSDSVGYYAWNGSEILGLIILNKGLEFHTYRIGDSKTELVSDSVGRFIASAKSDSEFWFYSKSKENPQLIAYDFIKKSVNRKVPPLEGCEDYGIDGSGYLYGGSNGTLYQFKHDQWKPLLDLSEYTGQFYRLAFCQCGAHMCVVGFTGKKP